MTHEIIKLPITITSELSDKDLEASITCIDKVIAYVRELIPSATEQIHLFTDDCSAQFRSRYVFSLLTQVQTDVEIIWHYNEAHHGKGPMDGIGGTIKRMVFRKVLSKHVVINSAQEFVEYAEYKQNHLLVTFSEIQ